MKYFQLSKVIPILICLYGEGFFSPSHGLCRPLLHRRLFVIVETPVTGWFQKLEQQGGPLMQYQRILQPVRFILTVHRRRRVPYELSFQNITADGDLEGEQEELHYDNITVLCPDEPLECSCQSLSLSIAGLDDFNGLYKMDDPISDTAGNRPHVPMDAADPASRYEGKRTSGAQAQGNRQPRHWPTWTLRRDVRPTKPTVGSGLGNIMTNLNFDPSVLARLPGGVNINHTTYLQMTAALLSSPRTGPSLDLSYHSERDFENGSPQQRKHSRKLHYPMYPTERRGHVKSDRNSPDRPDEDQAGFKRRDGEPAKDGEMKKINEKNTTKPKIRQLQHELSRYEQFWSKSEKSFMQMLIDYDNVVPVLGKTPLRNTFAHPSKKSKYSNPGNAAMKMHATSTKQSLEKHEVSQFEDSRSGRGGKYNANSERVYDLRKPRLRQQSVTRLPPQLVSVPHATLNSLEALNTETIPVSFVKEYSPPVTLPLIPATELHFSNFSLLDNLSNTGDYSTFGEQLKEQYSVSLQWDDELATLVLVSGGTLVAIRDQSSPCPDTSSGSWWQLTDKPPSYGNYTAHLQYRHGHERDIGTAGTNRGNLSHSPEMFSGGLQEPSILYVSSEEQNYADSIDLLAKIEQDTGVRLVRRLGTITCRKQRNGTLEQD